MALRSERHDPHLHASQGRVARGPPYQHRLPDALVRVKPGILILAHNLSVAFDRRLGLRTRCWSRRATGGRCVPEGQNPLNELSTVTEPTEHMAIELSEIAFVYQRLVLKPSRRSKGTDRSWARIRMPGFTLTRASAGAVDTADPLPPGPAKHAGVDHAARIAVP